MAVNLGKTLDWEQARGDDRAMLEDLQGNILKGHGRHHTAHLFLNFGSEGDAEIRPILRSIGRQAQSALDQLRDAKAFSKSRRSGGRFLSFYLTAAGYDALGPAAAAKKPDDAAFLAGMTARRARLDDPDPATFDDCFQEADGIHGMLLIAADDDDVVKEEAERWETLLSFGGIKVVGREIGFAYLNANGEGIEHFGYMDGRSQPLMLTQDIAADAHKDGVPPKPGGGFDWIWDPQFTLDQALTPDPGGAHEGVSCGSYFVFRKLEQDVRRFKDQESETSPGSLADVLGLPVPGDPLEDERERAGAMVVGRYEDGTPFAAPHVPAKGSPPAAKAINNFDFSGDPQGALCPFRAHIRKSNPRGDSLRLGATLDEERSHIMARRGITYGLRDQDPATKEFRDRPSGGVGLLFMAHMADIARQFEFTQAAWVNNGGFVDPSAGLDPVIGQGVNGPGQTDWPDGYGAPNAGQMDFALCVHLKGGEYFFAPSKSFLTTL